MPHDDIAELNNLRDELVRLIELIKAPGVAFRVRQSAESAICTIAIQAIDLCIAKLGAASRQRALEDDPV